MNAQELAGAAALAVGTAVLLGSLGLSMVRTTAFAVVAKDLVSSRRGALLCLGLLVFHLGWVLLQGGHVLGIPVLDVPYPSGVRCGPPTGGC